AYNQNGAGTASAATAPVSSTLPSAGPPPVGSTTPWAPSGLTGAPGDGQVSLNWSAPAQDGGSPLTGYVVVTEPGDQIKSLAAGTTGLAVSGLTNGTNYSFQVLALNANGASPAAVTA